MYTGFVSMPEWLAPYITEAFGNVDGVTVQDAKKQEEISRIAKLGKPPILNYTSPAGISTVVVGTVAILPEAGAVLFEFVSSMLGVSIHIAAEEVISVFVTRI